MEVLEQQHGGNVESSLVQSSLDFGISDQPSVGESPRCGNQGRAAGLGMDLMPKLDCGEMEDRQVGPLEVFHPGVSLDEQASPMVAAEALRCQVKITTRRSLHLRIANHTARDVYVRLVGHGGHIAEINTGLPKNASELSKTGWFIYLLHVTHRLIQELLQIHQNQTGLTCQ